METSNSAAALGAMGGIIGIVLVIGIALWILLVVGHWKMFTKAGEKGWKALIPFYSDYTLFKLVWNTKSFWIYVGAILATVALNFLSGQYVFVDGQLIALGTGNMFLSILAYVASIALLIYSVLIQINTSLAYGKGMVFAMGLLLLPVVFTPILGFGDAEYLGPRR